jgi:NodT family efflux transporter outer membrane factor (OMF) lipoprotein
MRARPPFLAACLAAITGLTGCAVKKPPTAPQIVQQSLPATTKIRDQWASPAASGLVQDGWLKTLSDPQAEAVVEEVLRNNLDLRVAATRVEVAAGIATQAHAQLLPNVVVQGSAKVSGRFENKRFNSSGIFAAASWEVDVWGKLRNQSAAAGESYEATEADVKFARESLAALAAKTWYLVTYTRQLQQVAQEGITVYQGIVDVVQVKESFGEVPEQNIFLARADLESAQAGLQQASSAHQEAVRALEVLMGHYPAAELRSAEVFPKVPPPVPAGLPSELLARRPDLMAAERRVAASFHLTQSAKAARLPSISLTLSGGRTNNDLFSLIGTNPDFWNAGANFLAPIYLGGTLQAQVRIQSAQQQAATLAFGQTALRALSEVETSLSNEGLLADREQYLQASVRDNSEAYRLGRIQFDVGATDLLSVLQLQGRLLSGRAVLIGVEQERLTNRINLHLALGGSFQQPASKTP